MQTLARKSFKTKQKYCKIRNKLWIVKCRDKEEKYNLRGHSWDTSVNQRIVALEWEFGIEYYCLGA